MKSALNNLVGMARCAFPPSWEKLTLTANFLPSAGRELPVRKHWPLAGLIDLIGFAGVFRNHAENLTMAQPLLKGELR